MALSNINLKLLREKQLSILKEFDNVCRILDLNYTLSSGTLLGAVRHQGFIPWDDDIDVAMIRDEYERFIVEGQSLLPSNMFIQTYKSDTNYPLNYGKIRDIDTELKEYSTKNVDMKTGVYIDIFPVDKISRNKMLRLIDNYAITLILTLKYSSSLEWISRSRNVITRITRLICLPFVKIIGTRALNLLETTIRIKNNKEYNRLTYGDRYNTPPYRLRDSMSMSIDIFHEHEYIKFENGRFKVIKSRDEYLKIIYGDYMQLPPEKEWLPQHEIVELNFNKM